MRAKAPNRIPHPIHPVSLLLLAALAGCGGGAASSAGSAPSVASEAEWRELATPRPEPLDGAPRVSVGEIRILGSPAWASDAAVDPGIGISELVAAGLLRRRDVRYVERRRFAAAAEAERRGTPRPAGAPRAGVSPGPELVVVATWSSVGLDSAWLDLRLNDATSGATVKGVRASTSNDADPTALARTAVSALLEALGDLGRLPSWSDPVPATAPPSFRPSGVPLDAVRAFFRGLAAEDAWDWETARRSYQAALQRGGDGFVEARAALARTARLHNGGTLGAG